MSIEIRVMTVIWLILIVMLMVESITNLLPQFIGIPILTELFLCIIDWLLLTSRQAFFSAACQLCFVHANCHSSEGMVLLCSNLTTAANRKSTTSKQELCDKYLHYCVSLLSQSEYLSFLGQQVNHGCRQLFSCVGKSCVCLHMFRSISSVA